MLSIWATPIFLSPASELMNLANTNNEKDQNIEEQQKDQCSIMTTGY